MEIKGACRCVLITTFVDFACGLPDVPARRVCEVLELSMAKLQKGYSNRNDAHEQSGQDVHKCGIHLPTQGNHGESSRRERHNPYSWRRKQLAAKNGRASYGEVWGQEFDELQRRGRDSWALRGELRVQKLLLSAFREDGGQVQLGRV